MRDHRQPMQQSYCRIEQVNVWHGNSPIKQICIDFTEPSGHVQIDLVEMHKR